MHRAKQSYRLGQFALAIVVLSVIALVLMLSIAIATGAAHSFHQIELALPIFLVLLFLAASTSGWLPPEDLFLAANPKFAPAHTRAPPVRFSF